jgi:hypothetical protein
VEPQERYEKWPDFPKATWTSAIGGLRERWLVAVCRPVRIGGMPLVHGRRASFRANRLQYAYDSLLESDHAGRGFSPTPKRRTRGRHRPRSRMHHREIPGGA